LNRLAREDLTAERETNGAQVDLDALIEVDRKPRS
jgi:hypothetical protein